MSGSPGRYRVEALQLQGGTTAMLAGGLNATRHAQKPLSQPAYNFCNVPTAEKNLQGSKIHEISDRDHFHESMAEMLLLCKEAMRRRRRPAATTMTPSTGGAKPLSLEYLADRLDIDDPCFGYLVRTDTDSKGMLQGFITATTFTNWQKSFRWDSANPAAYEFDEEHIHGAVHRKRDADGSLARGLQNTVRCGDIHLEGIVWPRICEISLLGALGCGRTLINLLIEHLECMKGSAKANYDYVVLQATDNSIPFYESMGFVRVGAVMMEEMERKKSPGDAEADGNSFVTSEIMSYTVRTGETLTRIAAKFKADVWDVIFLNKHVLGEAQPSSKPKLGTILMLPAHEEEEELPAPQNTEQVQWHTAKENETPRMIAKQYDVDFMDVVNANKGRLPGLTSNSRLKEGTRIKVSHFHIPENEYKAYAHWSFPDARFEDPEPSYMMVRKLNRRKANQRNHRPVQDSLQAPIVPYEPPPLLLPPSPVPVMPAPFFGTASSAKRAAHPDEPQPPKRPQSAYMIFATEQRELAGDDVEGLPAGVIRELWNDLSPTVKAGYEEDAKHARELYEIEKAQYEKDLEAFLASNSEESSLSQTGPRMPLSAGESAVKYSLYNKVVRLKPGAMTEASEYSYWYVLTFIPDLKWCHLAPMIQAGTFGADKPKAQGQPKWKLVDESLGKEVDISSSYCIPVKSRSMRKTLDADREEWLIIDDGTDPTKVAPITPRALSRTNGYFQSTGRRATAVKPSVERVRKWSSATPKSGLPLLGALLPGSKKPIAVRIVGKKTLKDFDVSTIKKRGRPFGSKNRPKTPEFALKGRGSSIVDTKAETSRRMSVVKFDMPGRSKSASPRKAAAVRRPRTPESSSDLSPAKLLRRSRSAAKPEGPSPGGILRRKSVLAALDSEKSVLSSLESDKLASSPGRGRKIKAPEAGISSLDSRGRKSARVSRGRRASEPDNNVELSSDSSDATYNESSGSSADSTSASDFSSESDIDSVGAVVTRMSPRLVSRGVPASVDNARRTRRSASLSYLGDKLMAANEDPDPSSECSEFISRRAGTRRSSRGVTSVDDQNAESKMSPRRSTRRTSTPSKGRQSPRRSIATNFYLSESLTAENEIVVPSSSSKNNRSKESLQRSNDSTRFYCNESLSDSEIAVPASFAVKPSVRKTRTATKGFANTQLVQTKPKLQCNARAVKELDASTGKVLNRYPTVGQAVKANEGVVSRQMLINVAKGRVASLQGKIWRYEDEEGASGNNQSSETDCKTAPSFFGDTIPPRKRRCVKSDGSRKR